MPQRPFDSRILKRAIRTAKEVRQCSDSRIFRLGAVIFNSKRVLTAGANSCKTSPLQVKYNRFRPDRSQCGFIHAEMAALLRLKRLYPDTCPRSLSILVYRETNSGEYAMAKPCPACERALKDYGIKHIYYSGRRSMCYECYDLYQK